MSRRPAPDAAAGTAVAVGLPCDVSGIHRTVAGMAALACLRPDRRMLRPAHPFGMKNPAGSRGAWDRSTPLQTTPAEEVFLLRAGGCSVIQS